MKNLFVIASSVLVLSVAQMCGCSHFVLAQSTAPDNTATESKTVKLKITGMTCAGCSTQISTVLKNINGVLDQTVEYPAGIATVKYEPVKTNPDEMIKAIEKIGFTAELFKEPKSKKKESMKTVRIEPDVSGIAFDHRAAGIEKNFKKRTAECLNEFVINTGMESLHGML